MAVVRYDRAFGGVSAVAGALGFVLVMTSSAFAVTPLTTVSTDPFTNTTSFHQTELEPDTFSFGSTTVAVFQVGRFSNGGASDSGFATTIDDGAHWTSGFMPGTTVSATPPGPWARISDPSIAFDAKHGAWLASGLGIDSNTIGKAVLVNRSTDGGQTFASPMTVSKGGSAAFYDKEWIACDETSTSPNFGNCYVEWDDAGNGNRLHMSRSTDGGLTWQVSHVPIASVIGGQPLAQPAGTVVVPISTGSGNVAESFVSADGGQNYTGPFTISTIQTHNVAGNLRSGGGLVSADEDGAGTIFVAWQDCRFRSNCTANDIVFSTSTDGKTWSAVQRIPVAPTTSTVDAFIPGFGIDHSTSGSTAHLGVTFYAYPKASCTTSTCQLTGGFVSSVNGGQTWSPIIKLFGPITLTWLPLTTQGYMVGDYVSTSYGSSGKALPVVANATSRNCQVGNVTSCHEFMVAPTNGLTASGGTNPSVTGPVLSGPEAPLATLRTAF